MNEEKGLYNKYIITKSDGSSIDPNAIYFVLRLDTDPAARRAASCYIRATKNYDLADDLSKLLVEIGEGIEGEQ